MSTYITLFLKNHLKPAFTKLEVGFLSGFSKVGFVENHGLTEHNTLISENVRMALASFIYNKEKLYSIYFYVIIVWNI